METDWAVGEVLKTLDSLGIAKNTIVIFTADNGTSPNAGFKSMQEKGHYPSWIYRGLKGTLWEGGHRMPFVLRWPKVVIKLKKELARIIKKGRSTPGANQPSDHGDRTVEWPQIDLIRKYLE